MAAGKTMQNQPPSHAKNVQNAQNVFNSVRNQPEKEVCFSTIPIIPHQFFSCKKDKWRCPVRH